MKFAIVVIFLMFLMFLHSVVYMQKEIDELKIEQSSLSDSIIKLANASKSNTESIEIINRSLKSVNASLYSLTNISSGTIRVVQQINDNAVERDSDTRFLIEQMKERK